MSLFTELAQNSKNFKDFVDVITPIMELEDSNLTDEVINTITEEIQSSVSPAVMKAAINSLINELDSEGITREETIQSIESIKAGLQEFIESLQPSENKRKILDVICNILYEAFDTVLEKYHNYDIELPIQLEEGAQLPTYAHAHDVAADLYALETITLPAHSISNMVKTGVHIELPEDWLAMIFPRSSIGAKTGLRLSNSAGIIDSGYRGALGIIYDNIADEDYTINKGDRIAQLLIMPSHRFKAKVVEALEDSDRGSDGFGSTGK